MNLTFSLDDLKCILKSQRRKILHLSCICSGVTFLYLISLPLLYEARATFKQASPRADPVVDIKNLFRSFSSAGTEGTSTTLMLSDTVLEKTAEEMGFQAEIQNISKPLQLARSIKNNILGEMGFLPQDMPIARFACVKYTGEKKLSFLIQRTSPTEYALYDEKKTFLATGVMGQPLVIDDLQWTIVHLPQWNEVKIALHPMQPTLQKLRKQLTIKPAREDKNLLVIRCVDQDRKRSAEIINTLMAMYEKYLIEENKIFIGAQLCYLNQRQEELSAKLDQDIQDHAKALQGNLQREGFLGVKDETELVLQTLQTYKHRSTEVELELQQIDQRLAQADLHTKSHQDEPLLIERYSKALATQILSAQSALEQIRRKEKIVSAPELEELQPSIEEFNATLEEVDAEKVSKMQELLHAFISQLTDRQQSLSQHSAWIQSVQSDLAAMSPAMSPGSARNQLDLYSTQLDDLHAQLKQIMYMRDHLFDAQFEISTLSNILADPVTQQTVQRSSELEAQLHDNIHRSLRERDRIKTALNIHKQFLRSHLDQTLKLGKIRIDLLKEKLLCLYTTLKTLLLQEQTVLQGKIQQFHHALQLLPALWVHENRLKFKSELTKAMMEGLASITETKNLAHHLYQVDSRPLDKAKAPLGFVQPQLLAKSAIAFSVSCLALALFTIVQAFIRGFVISLSTLQELGAHTCGILSTSSPVRIESMQDIDRETLRRAAAFLLEPAGNKIVSILGEKQTIFFPALTALLKKYGRSSLVIDCSFGKIISLEDHPGLFQSLNTVLPLEVRRSFGTYDFIPTGASSQDSVELLKLDRFKHLLGEFSLTYDVIFLISRTPICSLESEALLDLSTHAILMVEAPLEVLHPFIELCRQKVKKHVTFIKIEFEDNP